MNRYVLTLSKEGYMIYISHLDMMRLFKNVFKMAEIKLAYSQGFNPHPKMSFALPLSLGYSSTCELLEIETQKHLKVEDILTKMQALVPEGIGILFCEEADENKKSLASRVSMAQYQIRIPLCKDEESLILKTCEDFFNQKEILATKKSKKSATVVQVNIKEGIKEWTFNVVDNNLILNTKLSAGSIFNLSPELVISELLEFSGLSAERPEIDITRTKLFFS